MALSSCSAVKNVASTYFLSIQSSMYSPRFPTIVHFDFVVRRRGSAGVDVDWVNRGCRYGPASRVHQMTLTPICLGRRPIAFRPSVSLSATEYLVALGLDSGCQPQHNLAKGHADEKRRELGYELVLALETRPPIPVLVVGELVDDKTVNHTPHISPSHPFQEPLLPPASRCQQLQP